MLITADLPPLCKSGLFKKISSDSTSMIIKFYGYDLFEAHLEDGTVLKTSMDETTHLLSVEIPADIEEGELTVSYAEPTSFRAAELVSAISIIAVIAFMLNKHKKQKDLAG
jgi:hypothetical protein